MNKFSKKKEVKRAAAPAKAAPKQPPIPTSSNKILFLILFLFAFLLYGNTLKHEYAFDDTAAIVENGYTKSGIKGIPDLLTKDFFQAFSGEESDLGGRWRPLSLIMFAIEYELFPANPHVNHWMNVILYAILGIVILIMLQRIFPGKTALNFLVTLLFMAHPTHTEVVANIKSRDEILTLMGLCLAVLYVFKYIETQKVKHMVFACIAYFLSLTSKENGITFLAVIPLLLVCFGGKTWKQSFITILPLFAVAIVYIIIRWKVVGMIGDAENNEIMSNPFEGASFNEKYATIFKIMGKYLMLLLFPIKLAYDYSYNEIPRVGWSNPAATGSLLIIIALLAYSAINVFKPRNYKRNNPPLRIIIAFGILFYFITISIVSNLVFNIGAPMGDRFLFLPSLGFCIIVAYSLAKIFNVGSSTGMKAMDFIRKNSKQAIISFLILCLYSFKTIDRNPVWKNNRTLYESGIYDAPGNALNHHRFANQLLSVDAAQETDSVKRDAIYNRIIDELNKTIEIVSNNFNAYTDLGAVYENKNDWANALKCYDIALKYNPNSTRTLSNKGVILAKTGKYEEAKEIFRKSIEVDSTYAGGLRNMGLASLILKEYDNAIYYMSRSVAYEKQTSQIIYAYDVMAQAYQALGNKPKADSCTAIIARLQAENTK